MPVPSPSGQLGEVNGLAAICEDCGRRDIWRRDRIAQTQAARRLRSVVEFGTKLRCRRCEARGRSGKNTTIEVFDAKRLGIQLDMRKLSEIISVVATCGDCGHRVPLDGDALAEMGDVQTVDDLGRMAFCVVCRDAGTPKPNIVVDVYPPFQPDGKALRERPQWSRAEIFTDDRADPFANLPKSRLMRCVEA